MRNSSIVRVASLGVFVFIGLGFLVAAVAARAQGSQPGAGSPEIVVLLEDRVDDEAGAPLSVREVDWLGAVVGFDLVPVEQSPDGGQVLAVIGPPDDEALYQALHDLQELDGVLYADLAGNQALAAPIGEMIYVEPLGVCGDRVPCFANPQSAIDNATDGDFLDLSASDFQADVTIDSGANFNLRFEQGSNAAFTEPGTPGITISTGPITGKSVLSSLTILSGTALVDGNNQLLSYQRDVEPIFAVACANCHLNGGSSGGFNFDAGISALIPDYITPGDPPASLLWNRVDGGGMPPTGTLPTPDLDTIEAWILEGAAP